MAEPPASGRTGIRVTGWVLGIFWLVLFFGLVDLTVPLFMQARPEFFDNYLIDTGWGVLFTFFVGVPLCFLGARPDWVSAALMSAAAGVAVLIAAIASGRLEQMFIVVGLAVPVVVVWVVDRRRDGAAGAFRGSSGERVPFAVRLPLLGLAIIAAPPAIVYAAQMIDAARTGGPVAEITNGFEHTPVQAAFALTIPLAAAALALRLAGWRPMALLLAAGTAWFAVVSIVFPDHFGSWGTTWGWAAVAWAVVLGVVAVVRVPRRRG